MSESMRTTVVCQDPGDGSGEIIIEIPPDVLKAMSIDLGDSLRITFVDEALVNRPGFSRHLASSLRNAFQTLPVTVDC